MCKITINIRKKRIIFEFSDNFVRKIWITLYLIAANCKNLYILFKK